MYSALVCGRGPAKQEPLISDYLVGDTPLVSVSASESQRFERCVVRVQLPFNGSVDFLELENQLRQCGADLIILRSASQMQGLADWLSKKHDWRTLYAGTLLYFSHDFKAIELQGGETGPDRVDINEITNLAIAAFQSYRNHYTVNPDLPTTAVRDGYTDWLQRILAGDGALPFVATDNDRYVSFIVARMLSIPNESEIVLNGTHPDYESRGHYTRLLRRVLSSLKSDQCRKLWVSTQAINVRVIQSWLRCGFSYEGAIDTYHVTPNISDS